MPLCVTHVPVVYPGRLSCRGSLRTCRSLAGGKIDDWLYHWEYAAAHPDHDGIDFT